MGSIRNCLIAKSGAYAINESQKSLYNLKYVQFETVAQYEITKITTKEYASAYICLIAQSGAYAINEILILHNLKWQSNFGSIAKLCSRTISPTPLQCDLSRPTQVFKK